jgi:hypothetical protein
VTRIPPELNTIDKLNEHFKKFGSIVNIQVYEPPSFSFSFLSFPFLSLTERLKYMLPSISHVQLDPLNKQAFVQFTSNAEALLALRAPEAVMGNRFIQVYLKREEQQQEGGQPPAIPQPAPRPVRLTRFQPWVSLFVFTYFFSLFFSSFLLYLGAETDAGVRRPAAHADVQNGHVAGGPACRGGGKEPRRAQEEAAGAPQQATGAAEGTSTPRSCNRLI